jgi:geranylgeranyl reductase family protein
VERFDAIVVGAGPAGSTAAYRLARAGASVLLLERARFPRDKPCGGGLTERAIRLLPFPVDRVVEHDVDRLELRLRYGRAFERTTSTPLVKMTQRRRLDAYLAERAAAAGADVRDRTKVDAVRLVPDAVEVAWRKTKARAAVVIGADGVNGVTARAVGLGGDYRYGVALEGNVAHGRIDPERFHRRAVAELGVVAGGYGWVFPKGDHVNVGVGGWEREGPRLRMHLRRLCAAHEIAESSVQDLRGYRLPMRRPNSPLARGRVALVGDAAGLVDPLSGDGIYEALLSARLAAAAAQEILVGRAADFAGYEEEFKRLAGPSLSASLGAKIALDRFPRLTFAVLRLPPAWRVVEGVLRGELSHPGAAQGAALGSVRAVQVLSRAAVLRRAA